MIERTFLSFIRLGFLALIASSSSIANADVRDWIAQIDAEIFGQSAEEKVFSEGVALYKASKTDEALAKFSSAARSEDRLLKAKALHNAGLIYIEKKEAAAALDSLKNAAAYDNDSVEIKENLEWLIAHIKEEEQKKNKDQPQDQKDQDQKTAEEKEKEKESKEEKSQQANEKPGEEKQADKNKDGKENKENGEQKTAEEKEQEKAKEDKDGEKGSKKDEQKVADESKKGDQGKEDEKEKDKEKKDAVSENKDQAGEKKDDKNMVSKDMPQEGKGDPQMLLTPAEIKQQEAERLLRTIDDRIGRYPLTDTEATSKRGNDGKNW